MRFATQQFFTKERQILSQFWVVSFYLIHISQGQIVKLLPGDVKAVIFKSNDPWLLHIGEASEKIREIDIRYRGIFRNAVMARETIVQEQIFLQDTISRSTTHVIFPYGSEVIKKRELTKEVSLKKALKSVLSIPDRTVQLPNTVDSKNERLRAFFQEAYAINPMKFPVLFFTDSMKAPSHYKTLVLKYSSLFHFGIVHEPTPMMKSTYSIMSLPHFTALIVDNLGRERQPRVKKIPYVESAYGSLEYPYMVRFLYMLHKYHYKDLRHSSAHTYDVELDELFMEDLQRFESDYIRRPIQQKTEL